MRFTAAALVSTFAAFAAAYTQPDYSKSPEGNAILSPGLGEQVPEGKPYEIKWEPTVGKTVSLVLLRGPSENVKPKETIVESIPNSGSYKWTPSSSLTPDTTHYGLLLVVEGTGQYQWSTQFGISKGSGSSPSASIVTVIDDVTTTICPETQSQTPTPAPSGTIVTVINGVTTTICPETESAAPTAAPTPAPTGTIVTVINGVTTTICPETESQGPSAGPSQVSSPNPTGPAVGPTGVPSAPSSFSTIYQSSELTSTICPETESKPAVPAPTAPAGTASSIPYPPKNTATRVPKPSGLRSSAIPSGAAPTGAAPAPSGAAGVTGGPSGAASASPSATPYNAAGRTAASFGAIMAGVIAFLAL